MSWFARLLLTAFLPLPMLAAGAQDTRPEVVIGLVDTFDPYFYVRTFSGTVDYLEEKLPQYRIRAVDIDWRNIDQKRCPGNDCRFEGQNHCGDAKRQF